MKFHHLAIQVITHPNIFLNRIGNLTSPRGDPEKKNNIESASKQPPNLPVKSATELPQDQNYVFTEENDKTSDHIQINERPNPEPQEQTSQKGDTARTVEHLAEEFQEKMYDANINVDVESAVVE